MITSQSLGAAAGQDIPGEIKGPYVAARSMPVYEFPNLMTDVDDPKKRIQLASRFTVGAIDNAKAPG